MGARPARSRFVSQVLLAWLPLALILLGYAAAQLINNGLSGEPTEGATNALGFPLHVTEPAAVDRWIFGELPTTWLQERWHSPPQVHWYDGLAALVYISHFFVIPLTAAILWFRHRARFREWIGCVLLLAGIGIAVYVVYPMTPPWLAARLGAVGDVQRISGIGWEYVHLNFVMGLLGGSQMASNPVAAMPSLHAASAALLLFFCWSRAPWWARCLLVLYPLSMGLTLVYTGEHYVVDVVAGWLAAGLSVGAWRVAQRFRRRKPASRNQSATGPGTGWISSAATVGSRQGPGTGSRERRVAP